MAEYCIVISIVLGIDVAVAVVVFFNSIVFDRTVQFIKMEYWLTVTDLNRPYCNSLHHVPRLLLLYVYAIDYVCSSFFSRPSDHFYGESSNSSSHFLYGAFFSSALLFIKFQWMVVVWHPLYRSQKIHYWVLTHKCYKSIKKSTNTNDNWFHYCHWYLRKMAKKWTFIWNSIGKYELFLTVGLCFVSVGFSVALLLCLFVYFFSHVFEHCLGLSIVQMSEILWNLLFDWEKKLVWRVSHIEI